MKQKINLVFLAILAVVFLTLPVGAVLNTLSGNVSLFYENRSAAPLPQLSFESLWDGSFATQADSFVSDRIPGRDTLIRADTALGMALGRPVSHGVVTSADQLFPYHGYLTWDLGYTKDKAAAMVQPLAAIQQQMQSYGGTLVYLGIPQQYSYFRDSYPDYMDNRVWNLDGMTSPLPMRWLHRRFPSLTWQRSMMRWTGPRSSTPPPIITTPIAACCAPIRP